MLLKQYPTYDLSHGGRCGWTVLAVAIQNRSIKLVRHILKLRPELVNSSWQYSYLPHLFYAAHYRHMFNEFLHHGADLHLVDRDGDTVLDIAVSNTDTDIKIIMYLLRQRVTMLETHRTEQGVERIKDAYLRILGEDMFLHGLIECSLPYELRLIIWRYMMLAPTKVVWEFDSEQ